MINNFKDLERICKSCTKCELCKTRKNVVFGIGSEKTKVMFIGEGPGEQEDIQGEPFVGRAGKLLDKLLYAVDLDRNKNIYITNIVKCRPPFNRDPSDDEQNNCIDYLRNQTKLIKPRIIVCLGRIASAKIINPNIKITREHGIFVEKKGIFMMPMLHPAAILRNQTLMEAALKDFITLRKKIKEICPEVYDIQ